MEWLDSLIGSDADTILWWQMCIRAILIFFYGLALVRYAGKRVFGKSTTFDIVLVVILGSILSRALTANAQFLPSMAAATTLVLIHKLMAITAFHSKRFGHLVKGKEDQMVKDGNILWPRMKKNNFTEHDLKEELRIKGKTSDLAKVKDVYLERSGEVSVINK